jgi:hypothetical protein
MSTCLASFKPGLVLNNTWVLGERLGEGACGQVFRVSLLPNDKKPEPLDLIIKCAYLPKGKSKAIKDQVRSANTIYKEYQMHKGPLLGFKYIPGLPSKHRPVGEDHSHTYFVMQRLDYTLEEVCVCVMCVCAMRVLCVCVLCVCYVCVLCVCAMCVCAMCVCYVCLLCVLFVLCVCIICVCYVFAMCVCVCVCVCCDFIRERVNVFLDII